MKRVLLVIILVAAASLYLSRESKTPEPIDDHEPALASSVATTNLKANAASTTESQNSIAEEKLKTQQPQVENNSDIRAISSGLVQDLLSRQFSSQQLREKIAAYASEKGVDVEALYVEVLEQLDPVNQFTERFSVMEAIAASKLPVQRKEYLIRAETGQALFAARGEELNATQLDLQLSRATALLNLHQSVNGKFDDSDIQFFLKAFETGPARVRERFLVIYTQEGQSQDFLKRIKAEGFQQ